MTTVLAVSIGLPVIAALMWSARRQIFGERLADTRGVALQTVIVIVVMLVIAGAVAGVLLTRGGDVVSDLEGQSVGPVTEENCTVLEVSGVRGQLNGTDDCYWHGQPAATPATAITRAGCSVVGGTFTEQTTGTSTDFGGVGVTSATDDTICVVEL